jgi:hypothetical protein
MQTVREVGVDLFAHTSFSRELAKDPINSGFSFVKDHFDEGSAGAPAWLAERRWQGPSDPRDTAISRAWQAQGMTFFEYLGKYPEIGRKFGAMMSVEAAGKPMWADYGAYPVRERLGGANDDEVLVVDIGGGAGHDLLAFQAKYPDLKGRLVLQDVQYVVDQVPDKLNGIETMVHDFNKPQPIERYVSAESAK